MSKPLAITAHSTTRYHPASTKTTRSLFWTKFIPWEDVFIYRDPARVLSFYPRSGFTNGFQFQGCTRFAVKLDFIVGLLAKALRCTGGDEARGNQVLLGE